MGRVVERDVEDLNDEVKQDWWGSKRNAIMEGFRSTPLSRLVQSRQILDWIGGYPFQNLNKANAEIEDGAKIEERQKTLAVRSASP